jgi:hypothetical protein
MSSPGKRRRGMRGTTDVEVKGPFVEDFVDKPGKQKTMLVVNAEDSRSKPWSLDVGSNPGFA